MRKLRFFSTLLLLLFIFVGCDAPFEPSGCPEWDALIELQEENIEHVIYYVLSPNEENSEHLNSAYHNPEVIAIEDIKNQLTREQIEEWVALLKSLDCEFEKTEESYTIPKKTGAQFDVKAENADYIVRIIVYPENIFIEKISRNQPATYRSTITFGLDDYEKLYQFCQMEEDNT